MSIEVYVTYENSMRPGVTGVYLDRELAVKEKEERHDLDCIETFELKGMIPKNWFDMNEECKYFNKHLYTIAELINCLYELEDCLCGGLAHVVVDDDNFNDDAINFVLDLCNKEGNKDKEEVGLVKLICEELKKMSIQQRALLFSSYQSYRCDKDCENCPIAKGEMIK